MSKNRKVIRLAVSFLAAIAIWLYVDTVKMPSVPMRIRDIPVEFSGENTSLADKGLMLLSGYDTTIDLVLKGPRSQLYKMDRSDIRIVADTSSILEPGVQTLSYQVIYPDGAARNTINVDWASMYSVTVTVGELYAKEVPVHCTVSGMPQKNFYAEEPILDMTSITLRGMRDELLNVEYAEINVDISGLDETYKNAEAFTLFDNNNVKVTADAIRTSTKLIQVTVPIKTTKEVPLELHIQESAGATMNNTSYSILPRSVTLSGEKMVLADINSIILDTIYLQDIDFTQTLLYEIPVPENTELYDDNTTATVSFTITGLSEKTVTVSKFLTERVPEGFTGSCTTESIQVSLRGLATEIAAIKDEDVTAVIDFSDLTAAGEYTIPVKIMTGNYQNISAKGLYQVNVKLDEAPD